MAFNFKSAEDVKEYLKNIYIEYKFGCESEKNGNACHLLGDYMEGIKMDNEEAAKIYKSNCDERNWSRSCVKYGGYRAVGKGCEVDMDVAYKYMKRSCDLNDAKGCVKAGYMATATQFKLEGDRAARISHGIEMLKKSCNDHNEEQGCFFLSTIYLGALKNEVEQNLSEAHKLSVRCCDMGNPYACVNVSQMYARGEGVEKNASLAETFKQRALQLQREIKEAQQQLQFGQGIKS